MRGPTTYRHDLLRKRKRGHIAIALVLAVHRGHIRVARAGDRGLRRCLFDTSELLWSQFDRGGSCSLLEVGTALCCRAGADVGSLREELRPLRVANEESLPPFFGGAVGFFGYGVARWTERIPDSHADDGGIPDARLLFFDNVVVFDHVKQRLYVVANVFDSEPQDAEARIDRALAKLRAAKVDLLQFPEKVEESQFSCNFTRQEYENVVRKAKAEIVAGEILQIVLAQRWETDYPTAEALTLYRALRSVNPSPYMFLLRTAECTLVGASPEMLVRVDGKVAETPLNAGRRWRGKTQQEVAEVEAGLASEPEDNAEHLMLG